MAIKLGTLVGFLYILLSSVHSARVLMIPGPHNSHVQFFSKAGRALQDAGHEVYILTTNGLEDVVDKAGVNKLVHVVPEDKDVMKQLSQVIEKVTKGEASLYRSLIKTLPALQQICHDVNNNEELMEKIKNEKFDLVVNDGLLFYSCLYVIPYRFGLKYISLSAMFNPWGFGIPAMPSVEPMQLVPYTNRMSFFHRILNIIPFIIVAVNPISLMYSQETLEKFAPDKPYKTIAQLMSESQINLINQDVVCAGYPRISSPSYLYIGGASVSPAKPLPDKLQEFADGAKDGLIVLSFGSRKELHSLWPVIKPKVMGAFKRLTQRVIVQYTLDDAEDVPVNVKLIKWLPQNDLLGHPNTVLFITHGGNNGQLEAVYHGVPMLTIPFGGDQEFNGAQAVEKGFGLMLDRLTMKEEEIFTAVSEIINNPEYREKVRKCSAIQKSMPSSHETFVFWVNHVLEFGGDHLRSPANEMPMYQVLMLDVLLFLSSVIIVLIFVAFYACRFFLRKCCNSKKQKQE